MVNCAVITCKRRSITSNLKEHGISYHTFPKNALTRQQWTKFCGQNEEWQPTKSSVICSEHFTADCFETNSDRRKLINKALPTLKFCPCKGQRSNKAFITITSSSSTFVDSSSHELKENDGNTESNTSIEPSSLLRICRVCLVTGQKLNDMNMLNLSTDYNELTGLNLTNDEEYPQMLCWECLQRMRNWMKFRKKALRSHGLMMEILQNEQQLSNQNISMIDRHSNNLSSGLEIQDIDVNIIEPEDAEAAVNDIVIHKPKIDPLSDFVYEEDDAISLTDTDDDEFLEEYKEYLKLEGNEDLRETSAEHKPDMKVEIKCEPDPVNENGDVSVKYEDFDHLDQMTNDSMDEDMVLADIKAVKSADKVIKKDTPKPSLKRKLKKSKKIKKVTPVKKERKVNMKRAPKMSRKERSEMYFDKNLIEIVNIKIEDAVAMVQKRKDSENFKESDFKCYECFKGFYDKDVYDTHLEYHSLKRGEFQCHVCKVRFPKKLSVRKHLNNHLLNYSCKLCGFTTKSRIGAKRHAEYHKKGTLYKCPHCDHKFEKHTSYLGHIRKKHPSDIVCVLCGCSFVSVKGLDHHKKLKHRFDDREVKDDGPLCEECNIRFVSNEALIMHNHRRHNDNCASDEIVSPQQPEKNNRITDKADRVKSSEREKKKQKEVPPSKPKKKIKRPLKCEQCGLELSTIRAYYWHFRKQHPDKTRTQYFLGNNKYMCEICGRFFQKADILEDHILTHTGVKIYKCDRCGKEFNTNLSLTIHMKIHDAKRKRHACPVCGKTFLRSNNLKRHEYLHTGLRPFACDLCGKCFPTNSERKTHVEHAHFKKPWPKRNRAKENSDGRRRQMAPNVCNSEVMQAQWGTGSESNGDEHESQKMYVYM